MRKRLKYFLSLGIILPCLALAAVHDVTTFTDSQAGDRLSSTSFDLIINTIKDFFRDDNGTAGDSSDDKIGIGTNTPSAKLHLTGITADNSDYGFKIDDSADDKNFYVRNDGQVEFKNYTFPISDGSTGQILQTTGTGTLSWIDKTTSSLSLLDADSDTGIQVEESADEDKIRFDTAGSERMIINDAGKVGIGTSVPSSNLHTKGDFRIEDATDTTTRDFIFTADTSGYLHIEDSVRGDLATFSYAGINFTEDTSITSDISPTLTIKTSTGTEGGVIFGNPSHGVKRNYNSVTNDVGLFTTSGDIHLSTNNEVDGQLIVKQTTGNVGIGQTSPTARTHIKGSTSDNTAYSLKVDDSSDVNLFSIKNDGEINLPNTTFATGNNGVIAKNGTPFIHNFNYGNNGTVTTAGQNTFIGENSGNFTTGSTATSAGQASYNTAVGYNSLNSLTTGNANTAIGRNSLSNLTEGYNNTAVGYGVLTAQQTGYRNVAIGMNVLNAQTVGSSNIGIGDNTLTSSSSKSSNIGIGSYVLQNSTSDSNNIAFGYDTLRDLNETGGIKSINNWVRSWKIWYRA